MTGPLKQRSPFFGEFQNSRAPLEQAHIEACFQLRNAARQSGFRPSSCARSLSEPAVAGNQVEIGKREKIHVFHL
ncbi:hypothetical protein ABENE_07075 [Asticcacaulis benevestitus DSM 16100 = ATCC BAA-896]|uniref:Uncharacterized protein n=1 Tax=Asticcacaulis benevestitus DSM 16100 = ATCC BAA-896 TaxID=1121022 RepID=V4RNP0_9CAUL|nr:hypothetical protein ABENE_07075 [Asticcacaulis benevestitus DSM 16100 = ATCC BAA-896]